ncbi:hypothetical protein BD769DRAFT_1391357 [Suillus cothurnatus]|nr:hypothetical protein BD769DRAFT_1391357 [Suillus cothurnatus]
MEVMFDVGPGVKRNAGAVRSMSLQARERRALSAKRGKVRARARRENMHCWAMNVAGSCAGARRESAGMCARARRENVRACKVREYAENGNFADVLSDLSSSCGCRHLYLPISKRGKRAHACERGKTARICAHPKATLYAYISCMTRESEMKEHWTKPRVKYTISYETAKVEGAPMGGAVRSVEALYKLVGCAPWGDFAQI